MRGVELRATPRSVRAAPPVQRWRVLGRLRRGTSRGPFRRVTGRVRARHTKVIQEARLRAYGQVEGSPMDVDLMGMAVGLAMVAIVIALRRAGSL